MPASWRPFSRHPAPVALALATARLSKRQDSFPAVWSIFSPSHCSFGATNQQKNGIWWINSREIGQVVGLDILDGELWEGNNCFLVMFLCEIILYEELAIEKPKPLPWKGCLGFIFQFQIVPLEQNGSVQYLIFLWLLACSFLVGGFHQPIWNIWSSNWIKFPRDRDVK